MSSSPLGAPLRDSLIASGEGDSRIWSNTNLAQRNMPSDPTWTLLYISRASLWYSLLAFLFLSAFSTETSTNRCRMNASMSEAFFSGVTSMIRSCVRKPTFSKPGSARTSGLANTAICMRHLRLSVPRSTSSAKQDRNLIRSASGPSSRPSIIRKARLVGDCNDVFSKRNLEIIVARFDVQKQRCPVASCRLLLQRAS